MTSSCLSPAPPSFRPAASALNGRGPRGFQPLDALLALSVLLPSAVFGATAVYDRRLTLATAERDLLSTLDTLRGHAERILQFQTLALGAMSDRARRLSAEDVLTDIGAHHEFLRSLRTHAAGRLGLVIFDADGRPLVDAERPVPPGGISVRDRAYFRWHQENSGPDPFIAGAVRSRADGSPIFFVTLRWSGDDGAFKGVLAAGVRQSTFLDHWEAAVWDPRALVTLVRDDGVILARRPALDPDRSDLLSPRAPLAHAVTAGPERVVHRGVSPIDGMERLLAYRRLDRFGLIIAHGVTLDAALAPWRRRLPLYGAFAVAVAVALVSLVLLARRNLRKVQELNTSLEERVRERTAEIRASEERVRLLAREVDHRAKNALAVVQATLRLTPKDDTEAYAKAVEGRVSALARAQTLLAEDHWQGASLASLLHAELAAFIPCPGNREGPKVELDGPPVVLSPVLTQPLAMAVHELATNAVKHGALSAAGGRVWVTWSVCEQGDDATPLLELIWTESGGPLLVTAPQHRGFGSRVLDSVVRGQLGGRICKRWDDPGLVCRIEVPIRT
jgi:two-component sensor histidine kinase